jgi:hypothetical protein
MTDSDSLIKSMRPPAAPDPLPGAITRPRHHVQAVRAQSHLETGPAGRAALAWDWALTGTRPSPVTLSLAPGAPPTRDQILAEAAADPEGSTAPPGVPADYYDQFHEVRRILAWLAGASDEIPVGVTGRGRLIGARDDYARTDADIRATLASARRGLAALQAAPPAGPAAQRDLAWLHGASDLLAWVAGDCDTAPLTARTARLPTIRDLFLEQHAARDLIAQRHRGAALAGYGEAIQSAVHWLAGEDILPPVDVHGSGTR